MKVAMFFGFIIFCYSLAKNLAFFLTIKRTTQGLNNNQPPAQSYPVYQSPQYPVPQIPYTEPRVQPAQAPHARYPHPHPHAHPYPYAPPPQMYYTQNKQGQMVPAHAPPMQMQPGQQPYVVYVPMPMGAAMAPGMMPGAYPGYMPPNAMNKRAETKPEPKKEKKPLPPKVRMPEIIEDLADPIPEVGSRRKVVKKNAEILKDGSIPDVGDVFPKHDL